MKKTPSILLHPVAEAGTKGTTGRVSAVRKRAAQANGNGEEVRRLNDEIERVIPCENLDMNAILVALASLKKGDFNVRLPVTFTNTEGKVADAFNNVAELLSGVGNSYSPSIRRVAPLRTKKKILFCTVCYGVISINGVKIAFVYTVKLYREMLSRSLRLGLSLRPVPIGR